MFEDLIDEFFYLNGEHLGDFHALVVDMHKFDHMTFKEGDNRIIALLMATISLTNPALS
ncbi:hypothetical protein [Mesorhizobium sp. M1027]|uniref:hypothetical protein n=1 Tax=Mesorhizobium sp. M1027 TaxID=2957050 RepID=UPI0033398D52